jgi:hypothetical protein
VTTGDELGRGSLPVHEEFTEARFQRDGFLCDLQDLTHLLDGHLHFPGQLAGRGLPAQLLPEFGLGAYQFADHFD